MGKQRLDFLDFTRGIAAVVVLLSHAGASAGYFDKFGFGYEWLNLGQVGVIAFFAVSGFVIPLSLEHSKSMTSFAIRRIFRIYPLFIFMLTVAVSLQIFGVNYPIFTDENLLGVILANITLFADYLKSPNIVGGSWTLSIEIIWYVSFAIAFFLGFHRKPILMATLTSVFFIFIAYVSIILNVRFPLGRLGMLGVCIVGYLFYGFFNKSFSSKSFLFCTVILIGSISVLLWTSFSYYTADGTTFRCVIISWAVGMLIFLLPFAFRNRIFLRGPVFTYLGRYSYSIYLIHPLILFMCENFIESPALKLFFMISLSLLLSSVTYYLVESAGIKIGKRIDSFFVLRKNQSFV